MVMSEGLRRAHKPGATLATVSSYSPAAYALYDSMGFKEFDLLEPWVKQRMVGWSKLSKKPTSNEFPHFQSAFCHLLKCGPDGIRTRDLGLDRAAC